MDNLLNSKTSNILNDLIHRYPALKCCYDDIYNATNIIISSFKNGGKLLACGNGGSAADCEHIVGELMKAFLLKRTLSKQKQDIIHKTFPKNSDYLIKNLQSAVPAISLVSQTSLMTAFANDMSANLVFAQQVLSYGNENDVLLAISTSGNSENILYACQIAKIQGMKIISLTGETGGNIKNLSDICIKAPANKTFLVQEYHLPIYHSICAMVEESFFGEN